MSDDNNDDDTENGSEEGAVDHMAEMAAAMAADGVVDDSASDGDGEVDHMAAMAAAMEESNPDSATDGAGEIDHMAAMAAAMEEPNTGGANNREIDTNSAESIARSVSSKDVNIETLLKVPVSMSIEVGRTKMSMSDLLDTTEGSVIELERLLEEPLDILVNGALIAHGVVVLANEKFGLQITDIISLEERARSL